MLLKTRPRDYYDIYILTRLQSEQINFEDLKLALDATSQKRGSSELIGQYKKIMQTVKSNDTMIRHWDNYRKDFDYASSIEFEETCDAVVDIMSELK